MSYDFLLTTVPADQARLAGELLAWATTRPNWALCEDAPADLPWLGAQAAQPFYAYANGDTGVGFEVYVPTEAERRQHGAIGHVRVNLVRPRPFRLEVADEVAALTAALGCGVVDPRLRSAGRGGFDAARFAQAWDAATLGGLREVLGTFVEGEADASFARVVLPSTEVERTWRWSYTRAARAAALAAQGEDRFVPRVLYGTYRGRAITMLTWANCRMLTPHADYVLVDPDDDGRRDDAHPTYEFRLVAWNDAVTALGSPRPQPDGHDAWTVEAYPPALRAHARALAMPTRAELAVFPLEAVMECEVLAQARRLGPPRTRRVTTSRGPDPVRPGRRLN